MDIKETNERNCTRSSRCERNAPPNKYNNTNILVVVVVEITGIQNLHPLLS